MGCTKLVVKLHVCALLHWMATLLYIHTPFQLYWVASACSPKECELPGRTFVLQMSRCKATIDRQRYEAATTLSVVPVLVLCSASRNQAQPSLGITMAKTGL